MRRKILAGVLLLVLFTIADLLADQLVIRIRPVSVGAQTGSLNTGDIVIRVSGACGTGFTEVATLSGKVVRGTTNANGDVGGTGGADTITPAGSVSAPTLTMNAITSVINHTHTISITDPGHTHTQNVNSATTGATNGYGVDTSTNTPTASGYSTASATTGITASSANPGGGVASITPTGTASAPTFTGTQFSNLPAYTKVIFCEKS